MLEGAGRARALPWRMTLERRLEVLRISVEAASVLNESSARANAEMIEISRSPHLDRVRRHAE